MSKIFKIVLVCTFGFNSTIICAQLNQYLDSENARIELSKQTEIDIKKFIDDNYNHYILSQETNQDIINHLRDDDEFTDVQLENAVVKSKIYELRKLYFHQNPDKKPNYVAKHVSIEMQKE